MVRDVSISAGPMERPVNVLVWNWGREVSRYVLEMLHALRALPNLNIVLSCSRGSDLHTAARKIDGLAVIPVTTYAGSKRTWRGKVSALRGVIASPMTMLRFRRALQEHQIDVALCAQSAIWDVVTIPLLARGDVRYVQVAHEISCLHDEVYPLRDRLTHRQLAVADGIVVLSEQVRREVIDHWGCPANRCWKMPHGSYTYGSQTAAVHPRGTRPLRMLFFGIIRPYKGLDRLLAATQLLRDRGLSFKLIIAGSGDLESYQQRLASPDIEVHNRWLDDEQVSNLLMISDLVVLPYTMSSQSGVAAAAYGAGRPVVATPIGGLMEQVLPSTGVLARDMSAEAYADALADMITDPVLFDHCAAGALHYAQSESDWQTCARILQEVIQQVCVLSRRGWTQRTGHAMPRLEVNDVRER